MSEHTHKWGIASDSTLEGPYQFGYCKIEGCKETIEEDSLEIVLNQHAALLEIKEAAGTYVAIRETNLMELEPDEVTKLRALIEPSYEALVTALANANKQE